MRGDFVRVKCRGHYEDAQVRAKRTAYFKRKREGHVAGKRAFVKFVEYDKPDVGEFRVAK